MADETRLQRYLRHADRVTGYRRGMGRVHKLIGASTLGDSAVAQHVRANADLGGVQTGVGTVAGAIAGAIIGAKKGHPVLGTITGFSIGTNVPALFQPELRREALLNLAQTNGAVLLASRSPERSWLVFGIGYAALGVVRYLYGGETR